MVPAVELRMIVPLDVAGLGAWWACWSVTDRPFSAGMMLGVVARAWGHCVTLVSAGIAHVGDCW